MERSERDNITQDPLSDKITELRGYYQRGLITPAEFRFLLVKRGEQGITVIHTGPGYIHDRMIVRVEGERVFLSQKSFYGRIGGLLTIDEEGKLQLDPILESLFVYGKGSFNLMGLLRELDYKKNLPQALLGAFLYKRAI